MHWTQTPWGRAKLSRIRKVDWKNRKANGNGHSNGPANGVTQETEVDELAAMGQIVKLYGALPVAAKNYIRERLG